MPFPHCYADVTAVAQILAAMTDHFPSMDHHYPSGGRNIIRPESLLPEEQFSQQLHHPLHLHHPQPINQLHFQQGFHPFPQPPFPPPPHHARIEMGGFHHQQQMQQHHQNMEMFRSSQGRNSPPRQNFQGLSGGSVVSSTQQDPPLVPLAETSPVEFKEIAGGKASGRRRVRKRPKICGVCGDRAKSFHFGGLSCDSCKAFFRRSVQNDAHVGFRCAYEGSCDINISTRKSCQFCRFAKCLSIGMEKSWVMTEEERNAMNQQRLEKKQSKQQSPGAVQPQPVPVVHAQTQHSPPMAIITSADTSQMSTCSSTSGTAGSSDPRHVTSAVPDSSSRRDPDPCTVPVPLAEALAFIDNDYDADPERMLEYMSLEEQLEIKSVVETYHHAYKEMPFRVSLEEGRRDSLEIIEMFTTILRRFAYFSKCIPDFAGLMREDQAILLKTAVLEMCLLRGAACYDMEYNRWPSSTMESLKDCPKLRLEDMQRLVSRELFELHIKFIVHMKKLRIDEPIAMLLIMTVLFSPERNQLEDKVKINQSQEKYLMLLKNYTNWKFGRTAGSKVFPQLLTKLSDLRQLNDFHTEFHLHLDRKEVNAIKNSLMKLHLNPYPNWQIVPDGERQVSPEDSRSTSPTQGGERGNAGNASEVTSPTTTSAAMAAAASAFMSGSGRASLPQVTQALIQSFAERRIPTLLDNPYATFETDLSMIRKVQQTLGSLFPSVNSPQASPQSFPQGNLQRHSSTESESIAGLSPRGGGGASSTDSATEAEFSGSRIPAEYHTERLQQFLQMQRPGLDEGVIREAMSANPQLLQGLQNSMPLGSQSVLRKHTSASSPASSATSSPLNPQIARSSLPSSVIRIAPKLPSSTTTSSPSSVIQVNRSASAASGAAAPDGELSFRSISAAASASGGGWHGGEVHSPSSSIAASSANFRRAPAPTFYGSDEEEDDSYDKDDNDLQIDEGDDIQN